MPVTKRNATGAHFTRPDLARLVAERVAALVSGFKGGLCVVDPGCGDGKPCATKPGLARITQSNGATDQTRIYTDRCFIRVSSVADFGCKRRR